MWRLMVTSRKKRKEMKRKIFTHGIYRPLLPSMAGAGISAAVVRTQRADIECFEQAGCSVANYVLWAVSVPHLYTCVHLSRVFVISPCCVVTNTGLPNNTGQRTTKLGVVRDKLLINYSVKADGKK